MIIDVFKIKPENISSCAKKRTGHERHWDYLNFIIFILYTTMVTISTGKSKVISYKSMEFVQSI